MSATSIRTNTPVNTDIRGNPRQRRGANRNRENHMMYPMYSQDVRYSYGFQPNFENQYMSGPSNFPSEYDASYYAPTWSTRGRSYSNPQYQNRRQHQQSQKRPYTNRSDQRQQRTNQTVQTGRNSIKQESNAEPENLRSNLIEQLLKSNYECMICINRIQREQSIWSCEICFKMFHLNCIRKWAQSEESGDGGVWRCPGCQYSYENKPSYICFCSKRENPTYHPGDTPHSCGERCGKQLNKKSDDCRHQCTELCHPGPCPTCQAIVSRSCLCGRESQQVMCSSANVIRCEIECGKWKSCQHHKCNLICHARECNPCDVLIKQFCASHGHERQVLCTTETGSKGIYNCGKPCGKLLSCGHHRCEKSCHEGPCIECGLSPDACKSCACGKTIIEDPGRKSCLDPLPTCTEICGKSLRCGPNNDHHRCSMICHNGPCPPCGKQTNLQCRCGTNDKLFPCTEASQYDSLKNPYLCERRCNKKKICGKHRCTELCCDRDLHVCEIVCSKVLNCGNHQCQELCHRNNCRPCQIVSYDEQTCRCGRTVRHPPIACGTPLPPCNFPCNRAHTCDHPIYHCCHNEEECPPCIYLESKMCVGGHTVRHSIPCHLKDVFCGQTCGKMLSCGLHKCQRSCHSGPCMASSQKCTQKCNVKRRDCDHPCNENCHPNSPCPAKTCKEMILIRCPCGRLEKSLVCNIKPGDNTEVTDDNGIAQSLIEALSIRTIDLSQVKKQKSNPQQLECDDQCLIIQRNRKLAEAFSIDPQEPRLNSVIYTDFLKEYAKRNLDFIQNVERDLTQLVEETHRHRVNRRCHSFKPMKKNERQAIHELAVFYGLETESVDPEPQRNVIAYSTLGLCKLPQISLSETVRREKIRIPPPVVLPSQTRP